jgi:hypothetical protein
LRKDEDGLCTVAAHRGHLEMLQWARTQGCQWGPSTYCKAAHDGHTGHIKILDHLRDSGWEFPEDDGGGILGWGARGSHIDVPKCGLENDCQWSIHDCSGAAFYSRLEALKWMRSNGAPWDMKGARSHAALRYINCEEGGGGEALQCVQWITTQTTVLAGDLRT